MCSAFLYHGFGWWRQTRDCSAALSFVFHDLVAEMAAVAVVTVTAAVAVVTATAAEGTALVVGERVVAMGDAMEAATKVLVGRVMEMVKEAASQD